MQSESTYSCRSEPILRQPVSRRFPSDIAEIQGLYGAFSFPEKLLQKIWLRREFDHPAATTVDGHRIQILHPGRWNLLGGPDFRQARLRLGDRAETVGDVELHLHAPDWDAHAHARDPAYRNVVLHVVLFPPEKDYVTLGVDGRPIPVLVLLPLLQHDLEEYAADDAVESLSNRPTARLTNELANFSPSQLRAVLERQSSARWRQRVHFARLRVQRLGWEGACHHAALEVLGFRYNRSPMLRVATRWPLNAWINDASAAELGYASELASWSLQGVRPANHPRVRLKQYAAWVSKSPDWPDRLIALGTQLPKLAPSSETRELRRSGCFPAWRERFAAELCAKSIGGTRLDNLICDALVPLLAARSSAPELEVCWFHWFFGDAPPFVSAGLRQLCVCNGRTQPLCHGLGQGLLGWLIEREVRR